MKRLKITPVKHAQSGRWQVRIPAKLSGTGKRETKYFPTKAEAMGYITNLEDVAAGLRLGETLMTRLEYDAVIEELARLAPFDVTLKDVIDYYITRHRASDARKISILEPLYRDTLQDTSSHYRSRVRQVLGAFASVFGDCLIDDVTPDEFEKWLTGWKTTPPSYNSALRHIKPFFAWAISKKYAVQSPAEGIKQRKHQRAPISILTPAQAHSLLDACRDYSGDEKMPENLRVNAADMISFLAYSGLRIEEARRLVWGDIGKESISVPDIKHATSRRTLYINASLAEVIESLRRERRGNSPDDPVFAIENPRKALTNACIRLGLPHVRIHDLRHFFATSCIEAGIDIPTVAKWLGHRDGGALAMKVYGHLRDEHSKEAAKKLVF